MNELDIFCHDAHIVRQLSNLSVKYRRIIVILR